MTTNLSRTFIGAAALCAALALPSVARAEGAAHLESFESNGFGTTMGRVGLGLATEGGARPNLPSTTTGSGPTSEDYSHLGATIDFMVYGSWDKTRFGSLIGAEFIGRLGFFGREKADPDRPDPKADANGLFLQTDFAFDYAVVRWGGPISGRVTIGAGAGFDYLGTRWYTDGGRFYALILTRAQLWVNEKLGVYGSWHFIPFTANERTVREHRFEAAATISHLHAGARLVLTNVEDLGASWNGTQLGAFAAYAF